MRRAFAGARSSSGSLKVGGAALAITLVTYFAFPESYIFFGILHCIAVSSVLALPFLRPPPVVTLAAALACLVAPRSSANPALDHPLLDWLGLGLLEPRTNDYVPIFPWFGIVLIGVALGSDAGSAARRGPGLARWRAREPVRPGVRRRRGAGACRSTCCTSPFCSAFSTGWCRSPGRPRRGSCAVHAASAQANCSQGGSSAVSCRATCGCIVDNLRQSGLWPQVIGRPGHSRTTRRGSPVWCNNASAASPP